MPEGAGASYVLAMPPGPRNAAECAIMTSHNLTDRLTRGPTVQCTVYKTYKTTAKATSAAGTMTCLVADDACYMKAQLRLAGDRRKLGRNGFSSDIPRECVDPPENLRDLRDQSAKLGGRRGKS